MMRKTSLILLGAAAGVAVTLIATPPRTVFDGARAQTADTDTYRQLSLFGDVFERLRADYVETPRAPARMRCYGVHASWAARHLDGWLLHSVQQIPSTPLR